MQKYYKIMNEEKFFPFKNTLQKLINHLNLNTKKLDNFNAIEDRMLCRLHRMTRERFKTLKESKQRLAFGKSSFDLAEKIRSHLTLVYAIQTKHPLIPKTFRPKKSF